MKYYFLIYMNLFYENSWEKFWRPCSFKWFSVNDEGRQEQKLNKYGLYKSMIYFSA
jgi:hypothetical protein